jgi:transcriptional regulator with XRE-family HTH domain
VIDPQDVTAAQRSLGAQLARLREAAGHTQTEFAAKVYISRSSVANIETGHSRGTRDFWTRADNVLQASGSLIRGYEEVGALVSRQRHEAASAAADARAAVAARVADGELTIEAGTGLVAQRRVEPIGSALTGVAHGAHASAAGYAEDQVLVAPAGRFFDGLDIEARVYPAVDDGRILTAVPAGYANDRFLRRPRRGLVVGITDDGDRPRAFGLDTRQARRRLTRADPRVRLLTARAYALDDLTLGILWAVANLDQALLNDDGLLASLQQHLARYESLPQSAAGRDQAADLTTVSQMWLGSDFYARHILRHLSDVSTLPAFWTREQRGEEASTWLLFTHKYWYYSDSRVIPMPAPSCG